MQKSPTTMKHCVAPYAKAKGGGNVLFRKLGTNQSPIPNATEKRNAIYNVSDTINNANLNFQDICSAAFRINDGILKTPCEKSCFSDSLGCEVYYKKEFLQVSGSFKDRCARHILMLVNDQQRASGVITATRGNVAISMAYQGQQIGIPLTIVMPMSTPIMKIQICKKFDAEVIIWGSTLKDAEEYAIKLSKEKGFHYVDTFDHPLAITAAGTIGLEMIEQIPDLDAVIVPVGSGVLIAGISLAIKTLKPDVRIIGVESETCPNFSLALEGGRPITVHPESSIADELSLSHAGQNSFTIAAPLVEKVIVTREDSIALAVLRMAEKEKILIEGSGVCGLAALLAGDDLGDLLGKKVVVCLTEANMNTTSYIRCIERGLAVDGRLVKVAVTVQDNPGAITELTDLIEKLGINIKHLAQEQGWIRADVHSAKIEVLCESRDKHHALMLEKELRNNYSQISVESNFEMKA